jgi:hypothetical protein
VQFVQLPGKLALDFFLDFLVSENFRGSGRGTFRAVSGTAGSSRTVTFGVAQVLGDENCRRVVMAINLPRLWR